MKKGRFNKWELRPIPNHVSEDWSDRTLSLSRETGLSPITVRVCQLRGLDTSEAIEEFISPAITKLTSPFEIKDMEQAAIRLVEARDKGQRVRVFSDYDVDGTTGAALLTWVFRDLGFNFDIRQPDRFKDGYGLNMGAVEQAAKDGVEILITVDCGITNFEAAEKAKELGVELIIVDHHQLDPQKGKPTAFAVVNPQRPDCSSGLKQLCGCGLAFYLSIALRNKGREAGWFESRPTLNLKQLLDLVVIATAADMVPLTGDNRILVSHGMQILKYTKKPGLKALLEVAGIGSRSLSPGHLGFVLGPRINASGRMSSASLAWQLLTTEDPSEGVRLAQELEQLNEERAAVQNSIWDSVKEKVQAGLDEGRFQNAIVVADAGWHEGVIGIVASRVVEAFEKPAIVISIHDGVGKGSVRSYGKKNVLEALRKCDEFMVGYGGHKYAAGLSLKEESIFDFAEAFDHAVEKLPEDEGVTIYIEGSYDLSDFDIPTIGELEKLGPFGPGNPEPVFEVEAKVQSFRVLKDRHLKLNLKAVGSSADIDAIWFNAAEDKSLMEAASQGSVGRWVGVPELNRFRGKVNPSFRVRGHQRPDTP